MLAITLRNGLSIKITCPNGDVINIRYKLINNQRQDMRLIFDADEKYNILRSDANKKYK